MADMVGTVVTTRRAAFKVALAFLCVLGASTGLPAQNRYERASATFAGVKYIVQPGDQLRVRIWGWPEPKDNSEATFPVEATGLAYLPVIGAMTVAGKTAQDIQEEYRKRFAVEQRNPVVTVDPIFAVSVMGEVRGPGVVDVLPGYTIFDAISVAGGFSENADRKTILLVRKGTTLEVTGSTPAEAAAKLATTPLESGDRLVIQRGKSVHLQSITAVLQAILSAASLFVLLTR